jgi:hypothetical protein
MFRRSTFLFLLLLPLELHARGGHGAHTYGGSVHVHGYNRRDGTYVQPYGRSATGTKAEGAAALSAPSPAHPKPNTCVPGRRDSLCEPSTPTPEELSRGPAEEREKNLKTCLTGRVPALCDHTLLSPGELSQVLVAERLRLNLAACSSGKARALCDHSLLTTDQLRQVLYLERLENLRTCLNGALSIYCDHSLLNTEELRKVRAAESRAHLVTPDKDAPEPKTSKAYPRGGSGYINSQGERVPSPTWTKDGTPPAGASAQCGDGSYSFSRSPRGTCSHHGGVARWL